MATTITSNYYAIDVARTTTAGARFNLDIAEILKSKIKVIEIAVVEQTVAPAIQVNLPNLDVLKGQVDFKIIIRDAHRNIDLGTTFEVNPFDDGAGYADCIGSNGPGSTQALTISQGMELWWCQASSPTLSPNSGFWGVNVYNL